MMRKSKIKLFKTSYVCIKAVPFGYVLEMTIQVM